MAAAVFIFFVVASNCANAEVGKLIDGAPEPLLGKWGSTPQECAGAHRAMGHDNYWSISKFEYSFCAGSSCGGSFLRHRQVSETTYRLDSVAGLNQTKAKFIIEFVSDDIIVRRYSYDDFAEETTFVRCNKKHALLNVGLPTGEAESKSSDSVYFSISYAESAVQLCPTFALNDEVANHFFEATTQKLLTKKFERNQGTSMPRDEWVKFRIEYAKKKATEALADDEKYLGANNLCETIDRAFGANGNVIPNLLINRGERDG